MAKHSYGGGKHRQTKAGKKRKAHSSELFPTGGVMAVGQALTDKLKKLGDYGRLRWNSPHPKNRRLPAEY